MAKRQQASSDGAKALLDAIKSTGSVTAGVEAVRAAEAPKDYFATMDLYEGLAPGRHYLIRKWLIRALYQLEDADYGRTKDRSVVTARDIARVGIAMHGQYTGLPLEKAFEIARTAVTRLEVEHGQLHGDRWCRIEAPLAADAPPILALLGHKFGNPADIDFTVIHGDELDVASAELVRQDTVVWTTIGVTKIARMALDRVIAARERRLGPRVPRVRLVPFKAA